MIKQGRIQRPQPLNAPFVYPAAASGECRGTQSLCPPEARQPFSLFAAQTPLRLYPVPPVYSKKNGIIRRQQAGSAEGLSPFARRRHVSPSHHSPHKHLSVCTLSRLCTQRKMGSSGGSKRGVQRDSVPLPAGGTSALLIARRTNTAPSAPCPACVLKEKWERSARLRTKTQTSAPVHGRVISPDPS